MRIIDVNDVEVLDPDYTLGYTINEKIILAHHDAIPAIQEQFHYEVEREYPNGGKELRKVIDVVGQEEVGAWDETEDILRYILYTPEQLEENEQIAQAEEALRRENALLKAQVAAMVENQQFLEECLVEMAELVYA